MPPLRFEDFATPAPASGPASAAGADTQELRLTAYEEGYKAGWDDASAAEAEARARISADFAKTLQEMSFSYHEARAHILDALAPLLRAMVERVMPRIAEAGFAQSVAAIAIARAEEEAGRPVALRVSPENRAALEALTEDSQGLPLSVVEDETLGPGQALIAGPGGEREIDIAGMLAAIQDALDDFLTTQDEEARRHA